MMFALTKVEHSKKFEDLLHSPIGYAGDPIAVYRTLADAKEGAAWYKKIYLDKTWIVDLSEIVETADATT